jgi:hypothetical protein
MNIKVLALATLLAPAAVFANESNANQRIAHEQQQIDQGVSVEDARRVLVLSNDFKLSPDTIQSLRNQGKAWGEITVTLATADLLYKQNSAQFPTQGAALAQVNSLRSAGRNWAQVMDDLRLNVEPVVVATKKARIEMHGDAWESRPYAFLDTTIWANRFERPVGREALAPRPEVIEQPARPTVTEKPETPQPVEHPEVPTTPEKVEIPEPPAVPQVPERVEVPETPQVPERVEIPETPTIPEKVEVPETPTVPDRVEIPETPQVPDRVEVPETPQVPERVEVPETPQVPERVEVPETPQVPERVEVPEVPQVPERVEVPEVPEIPQTPERVELPQPVERPEQIETLEKPETVEKLDRPDQGLISN